MVGLPGLRAMPCRSSSPSDSMGFESNAVQKQFPKRLNDPAGGVLDADAAAAGEQYRVAFLHSPCDGFPQKILIVHDDAVGMHFGPLLCKQGAEQSSVYIPNLTGQGLLLGRDELVSGRDDADVQPA